MAAGLTFGRDLKRLLKRPEIRIKWGDQEIQVRDLGSSLDKELEPLRDEVAQLRNHAAAPQPISAQPPELAPTSDLANVRRQIHSALQSSEYKWRSVDRLAMAGGTDNETALQALRSDPEVTLSVSKNGETIAGLRERVGN